MSNESSKQRTEQQPPIDSAAGSSNSNTDHKEGHQGHNDAHHGHGHFDLHFLQETWDQFKHLFSHRQEDHTNTGQEKILKSLDLKGVADYIKSGQVKNIILMTGAGVSTSAGIPDFRSPNTGLYANMGQYNLPHPQAMFEIHYFKAYPEPFFALAKNLIPIELKPTPCHYFMRMLHEKGLLLRSYTQNIDSLEHIAGLPEEKVVEAHGSFHKGHCMSCHKEYTFDWMKENIQKYTVPKCSSCNHVVKPDVVLFGESLPGKFFSNASQDFPKCDLLLIMGTSLVVQPFASLVSRVRKNVPRLLINKEKVGCKNVFMKLFQGSGLDLDRADNFRDAFWQGSCDEGCLLLAELLGWKEELDTLIQTEHQEFDKKYAQMKQ